MRYGILLVTVLMIGLSMGCSPQVGSEKWCDKMKQQPKGDWSANDATDFAKHCIL